MVNGTTLVTDHANGILHQCSECHSDNAIGAPGKTGVESLSLAMHNFHKDKMTTTTIAANTTPTCYNCHPGPNTQCMRGIMEKAGKTCIDCHGDMNKITSSLQGGRQAWLQEPKCGENVEIATILNTRRTRTPFTETPYLTIQQAGA